MRDRARVQICTNSLSALQEPGFLIQHDGKFYVTLAVLEYDPNHERVRCDSDGQPAIIIREMQHMISDAKPLPVVPLPPGQGYSYANTFANTDDKIGGDDDEPVE